MHAGPTCPVEQSGNPCPPDWPVETSLRLERADGTVVAKGRSNSNGNFRIAAPPGKYRLVADDYVTIGPGSGCQTVDVLVETNRFAYADMSCDSGIR